MEAATSFELESQNSKRTSQKSSFYQSTNFYFSIFMSVGDVISDIAFMFSVSRNPKTNDDLMTFCIIFLLIHFLCLVALCYRAQYDVEMEQYTVLVKYGERKCCCRCLLVFPAIIDAFLLETRLKYLFKKPEENERQVVNAAFLETILESIPQLILQSLITAQLNQLSVAYIASAAFSSLSILRSIWSYMNKIDVRADLVEFVINSLTVVSAPILVLTLIFTSLPYYIGKYAPNNLPGDFNVYINNGGCLNPVEYSSNISITEWGYGVKCFDNSTLEYFYEVNDGPQIDCNIDFDMFSTSTTGLTSDYNCKLIVIALSASSIFIAVSVVAIVLLVLSGCCHVGERFTKGKRGLQLRVVIAMLILSCSITILVSERLFQLGFVNMLPKHFQLNLHKLPGYLVACSLLCGMLLTMLALALSKEDQVDE